MNNSLLPIATYIGLIVALFLFFSMVSPVEAQTVEGLTTDTLQTSSSPGGAVQSIGPTPKRHLQWTAGGLFHLDHKLVKRTMTTTVGAEFEDYPLYQRVQGDLSFAIGLKKIWEFGLVVPVILYQSADAQGQDVQTGGVGDPRLEGKVLLLDGRVWDLGAGLTLSIPIGHYASSGTDFMGMAGPGVHPKFLASADILDFLFIFNLGILFRPIEESAVYDQRMAGTWSVSALYDVRDFEEVGGMQVGVENNGQVAFGIDSLSQFPWELLGIFKYRVPHDVVLVGGAGIGLTDALGTPLFRLMGGIYFDQVLHTCEAGPEDYDGFQDDDKCIDPDNDHDGILDGDDKCPNQSEDFDQFQDDDGCPEFDNDEDGVPDVVDKCPMVAEDKDDFEDDDGCPEEGPGKATVQITDSQLLLSSKIYFDYNKAEIKEISHEILDMVALTLNNNPDITLVSVEGHTDNEGTEKYNQQLSEDRAKSVVEYLVGKSVARERLTYKGFGFSMPKASNNTEEGRAINRRVEFKIQKAEK
ncbi:MAG: OmpA family protein [Deltaproteobacteria bacterium]|nr:OmpA family protein [Deltaproteobacteria bacterium]MBN2674691.1 OmpA family protein [Deltaproteobacteria bacterium]